MAITEKWASSAGAGLKDGSSEANAWDWATMLTSAQAGHRVNFKGNHTLTANAAFSNNGTVASPLVLRGYSSTPGDLVALSGTSYRTNGNGPLITAGFPTINTGAYKITTPQNSVFETLIVVGQCTSDGVVLTGARTAIFRCAIANSATSGSHAGINLTGTECVLCDCDIVYSGTVNTCQAVFCGGTVERILSCRIDSAAKGINLAGTSQGVIIGCLIVAVTDGIAGSTAASTIYGNTILDCGSDAWHGATSNAGLVAFVNNRITDNGAYGLYADPTVSADAYWFLAYNRFDRNVSGKTSGAADWVAATSYKQHDTSQPQADEYFDFVTGDYRLKSGAEGKSEGVFSGMDMGALQLALPDLPPVDDVEEGTTFGYYGENTGTFAVPAEAEVSDGVGYGGGGEEFEGNVVLPAEVDVKDGVLYGPNHTDMEGEYVGGGTSTDPGEANVKNGVEYMIDDVAKEGTLVSTDPGEVNVLQGVSYIIESVDKQGTYVNGGTANAGTGWESIAQPVIDHVLPVMGEMVVYVPAEGEQRSIRALVDREEPEAELADLNGQVKQRIRVTVINSATIGIAASELLVGSDQITVARRKGGTPTPCLIVGLLRQDEALLEVELS